MSEIIVYCINETSRRKGCTMTTEQIPSADEVQMLHKKLVSGPWDGIILFNSSWLSKFSYFLSFVQFLTYKQRGVSLCGITTWHTYSTLQVPVRETHNIQLMMWGLEK